MVIILKARVICPQNQRLEKCNKNEFKLVTRLSLNGKPSRLELEMKTRVNILKD